MENLEGDLLANGFEKRENFSSKGGLLSITYSRPIQYNVIEIFKKIESLKYRLQK